MIMLKKTSFCLSLGASVEVTVMLICTLPHRELDSCRDELKHTQKGCRERDSLTAMNQQSGDVHRMPASTERNYWLHIKNNCHYCLNLARYSWHAEIGDWR